MTNKTKDALKIECCREIHLQRLEDEAIFQLLIKRECLKENTISDLKHLSWNIGTLIRNIRHEWNKNKPHNLNDDIANDPSMITNLLIEKYAPKKTGEKL